MTANPCNKPSPCYQPPVKVSDNNPQQLALQLSSATDKQLRMELIQEMIFILVDNDNTDSIIPFLESMPDTEAKWMLVPEYISKKRFNDAETVLNNLQKDNLEKQKKDEYYRVHIELGKTDRMPTDMTAFEKTTVEQVALSETEVSYNAKAMLHFWFNEKYDADLAVLGSTSKMAGTGNEEEHGKIIPSVIFNNENRISHIYPNPNDGNMQMDYFISSAAILTIYDITGRMVDTYKINGNGSLQISNNNLNEGIYFYEVISDGALLLKEKLVIIK